MAASTPSREELLGRARELVPVIRERAAETEALRRLPDDTLKDLHDSGILRILQPKRVGGFEQDFLLLVEIGAELARGCGATSWNFSNWASHHWMLAMWPEEAQAELWGESLDTLMASSFAFPMGKAVPADGGYRLKGRWPFSSGVAPSTWNMLAAMVEGEGDAQPHHRVFLVPASDFEILDNWYVAGLSGTGSNDVRIEETFVPAYRTTSPLDWRGGGTVGSALNPGPLYRLPVLSVFPYCLSGVALGIAQGALDGYLAATAARMTTYTAAKMADYAVLQVKVAEAAALIDAARLIMERTCNETREIAEAGGIPEKEKKLRYRRDGSYSANLCVKAVDLIFSSAGGGALYSSNPLQRAFRDVHAAVAHIALNWEPAATAYGKVALGLPSDNPLL